MKAVRLPALAIALIMAVACSPDGSPRKGPVGGPNPVKPTEAIRPANREAVHQLAGTIHLVDAEGGVYVLRTADGQEFRLNNLPQQFRQEGLAVEVDGLRHDDVLTQDMAGQAIDLLEIRRKDSASP